jgi:pSer/pThr/pTyr-binding forkhead associated (FHA) protein
MPTVFCTQCGQGNPEDARFCARCGAALVRPGAPVPPERPSESTSTVSLNALESYDLEHEDGELPEEAAVEALSPGSALLVVRKGPSAGSRFLLDKELTTAGRHPESDIFLDDVTVSRRHAEFVRSDNGFLVRDVGSLNGTYLNRERIDEALLSSGDEVQVGKFRLIFLTGGNGGAGGAGGRREAASAGS